MFRRRRRKKVFIFFFFLAVYPAGNRQEVKTASAAVLGSEVSRNTVDAPARKFDAGDVTDTSAACTRGLLPGDRATRGV